MALRFPPPPNIFPRDFSNAGEAEFRRVWEELRRAFESISGDVTLLKGEKGDKGENGDKGDPGTGGGWNGKSVSVTSGSTTSLTVESPQTITVLVPYCSSTTIISLPSPKEGMVCIVLIRLASSALPTSNNIYFKDNLGNTISAAVGNSPRVNYYSHYCYVYDDNGTFKWDAQRDHSWSV